MMSIAYLSNSLPEPIEPYVGDEIRELRHRGYEVVACSFRRPRQVPASMRDLASETLYIFPLRLRPAIAASWLLLRNLNRVSDLIWRALRGPGSVPRRVRTLVHTWLGAYLATALHRTKVTHIHIHHGYFSAWAGMVAARLLQSNFSLTLHGSDLLVRADYLDCKLKNCQSCVTVSDFNRRYILARYPEVSAEKIIVHRLGIDMDFWAPKRQMPSRARLSILSVGRLHAVKNYGFLILACHALKTEGLEFRCVIAGGGDQRNVLKQLIHELGLEENVFLRGYVARELLPALYAAADVVVLTSSSEGIPVALMEAMAMERLVLAPAITGIPELIQDGKTGFLYEPDSIDDFVQKLIYIRANSSSLDQLRQAARRHIELHFNQHRNVAGFARDLTERAYGIEYPDVDRKKVYEDPVLQ